MKKLTAKALAALMACTMIPATLPIVSNAEVNDVIDGTVLYYTATMLLTDLWNH